jgi:hypothetical protein
MADLEKPRPADEWDAVLKRVRLEVERVGRGADEVKPPPPGTTATDPAARSPDLAAARKFLTEELKVPAARVKKMPPAQVLVLAMKGTFRKYSDDQFKAASLPYPQARLVLAAAHKRLKAAPDTEAGRLAGLLMPRLDKVLAAQNRLQRRIAALRVVEALRLHAAAKGRLPDRLSEVKVVPIPRDPGTGQAFHYERAGDKATLTGRIPGEPLATTGLRYQITLRNK